MYVVTFNNGSGCYEWLTRPLLTRRQAWEAASIYNIGPTTPHVKLEYVGVDEDPVDPYDTKSDSTCSFNRLASLCDSHRGVPEQFNWYEATSDD